jgi:hypothetical protein
LRITPERIYSKQENRKSAVFCEFSMLGSSLCTTGGIYQGCSLTVIYVTAWKKMQISMNPNKGVSTFRETKSAVGRFRQSLGAGPAHPMKIAIGRIRARSMKRN